jgi:GNAT superfamily N-acetyltransferase
MTGATPHRAFRDTVLVSARKPTATSSGDSSSTAVIPRRAVTPDDFPNENAPVPYTIRAAMISDRENLQMLYCRSSLSNDGDRDNLLSAPGVLALSDDGVREGRTRVALDTGGSIVGFATYRITGDTIELEDLFVDPPWMRHGVGRQLVLDVVTIARARSLAHLHVTTNPHAAAFSEDTGFVADRVVETRFSPAVRMHLEVRP